MEEKDGNSVRFRLFFDDRHLLNKSQRSQGLRRCWILLKSGLATVGDLGSHIRETFCLRERIVLSIDDFVLPAFESISIITDKDIIRVTKKEVKQKDFCRPCDGQNLLQDSQIARVNDLAFSKNLLVDGNSQERLQGNGNYDKEMLVSCMENEVHVGPSSTDIVIAKRKMENSNKLPCSNCREELLAFYAVVDQITKVLNKWFMSIEKETGKKFSLVTFKFSSFSDWRKKAEEKSIERLVTSTECVVENKGSRQSKSFSYVNGNPEDALHAEYNRFEDEDGLVDVQADLEFHLNVQKTSSSMSCRERGQCDETEHYHEFVPGGRKQNDVHKKQPRLQMIHHSSDREEDALPVVVRPGYIRFEQQEDIRQQADGTQHSLLFNGVSSTNRRNWNEEKDLHETNNDDQCLKSGGVWSVQKPEVISSSNVKWPHKHLKHFESLAPLSRLPVKGDILAYRYVAQSSSSYRELSFPQVGKVSSFDKKFLQITLVPVLDYEILLGENHNRAILQQNAPLDQEGSSFEIDYSSLVDVRLLKAHDDQDHPARADGWEEALAKGNSNDPNASAAEKSSGWAQWIPNKSMASASLFCKQGRSNEWTNPGPNQCMPNWTMNKYTTYRTQNMNNSNWTQKMGNPGWAPHVNAIPTPCSSTLGIITPNPWSFRSPRLNPPPWGPHQNKIVQRGGKFNSGK